MRATMAAAFVLTYWGAALCNVPSLCPWLDATSALFAAFYLAAYLREPAGEFPVLGRYGGRLLAGTAGVVLLDRGLVLGMGESPAPWSVAVDVVAWAWILWTSITATRWVTGEAIVHQAGSWLRLRHVIISALIVTVLGLQVYALFRPRPTWWPFIDYPLYSAAHGEPIRTVHHRMYGLTADEPVRFIELTAERLDVSWFVYHTQTIPLMFDRPSGVLSEVERTLERARLPKLQMLMPVRETFALVDSELVEFAERRLVRIDPIPRSASR